jgi:lipoprotein-anchoring transpeptidase ErfK/SrfK
MKKSFLLSILFAAVFIPQVSFGAENNSVDAAALLTDSDGDGYSDVLELMSGYDPKSNSPEPLPKTIKVSLKEQRLRYYTGEYLVKEIKISRVLPSKPTPKGTFTIDKKMPSHLYAGAGYFYPNTKWNMRFKFNKAGSYYIHGAYWHNAFGTPRSHGCINVAYKDVETLYNWAPMGTQVTIE